MQLATEVIGDNGELVDNADRSGPLRSLDRFRKPLEPPSWFRNRYYADPVTIELPRRLQGSELRILVGITGDRTFLKAEGVKQDSYGLVELVKLSIRRDPARLRLSPDRSDDADVTELD